MLVFTFVRREGTRSDLAKARTFFWHTFHYYTTTDTINTQHRKGGGGKWEGKGEEGYCTDKN